MADDISGRLCINEGQQVLRGLHKLDQGRWLTADWGSFSALIQWDSHDISTAMFHT